MRNARPGKTFPSFADAERMLVTPPPELHINGRVLTTMQDEGRLVLSINIIHGN